MNRRPGVKTWGPSSEIPLLRRSDELLQNAVTNSKVASNAGFKPSSSNHSLLDKIREKVEQLVHRYSSGKTEPKKVAMWRDHRNAAKAGRVHLIPIIATIILLVFNLNGYYIGSELAGPSGLDDQKFFLLQFAAKLHELAILASLTNILFSMIRHDLATAGGLPFGALFAGFQFKDISFLWSLEFWGVARAKMMRGHRRWTIVTLVIVCTFLSLSAGPSSATLMRPRLDLWPAGGSHFWLNMRDHELWSTNVTSSQVPPSCATDDGDPDCPYGDWQTIAQDYLSYWRFVQLSDDPLPYALNMPGNKSVRTIMATTRSPLLWVQLPMTVATVPSLALAYGLAELDRLWIFAAGDLRGQSTWRFWSRQDVIFSLTAKQPVVHARCLSANASAYDDDMFKKYNINNQSVPFYDLHDMETYKAMKKDKDFAVTAVPFPSKPPILDAANSSSEPDVHWVDIGSLREGEAALGAILTVPSNSQYDPWIYMCTVDARIAPAALRADKSRSELIVEGFSQDGRQKNKYSHWSMQQYGTYGSNNTWPRFSIDPDWADSFLNPVIASDNTTSFQSMMGSAGLWNTSEVVDLEDARFAVESLLVTTIVNGLSRRDYMADFAGTLKGDPQGLDRETTGSHETDSLDCGEWCKEMMPAHNRPMGYGGNAFNVSTAEQQASTKFTMNVDAQGYAYSPKGLAAKFAAGVLLLHLSIALCHWMYTFWKKESFSSWAKISELVALAMSSTSSEVLINTGAGIESIDIFKKETKIVERDGRLQLAIDVPSGRYPTVKPNELYA